MNFTIKRLCLFIFLFVIAAAAEAQKYGADKIYWIALDKYTLALDSVSAKYPKLVHDKIIYLQKPEFVDSIPPVINGYKLQLITPANQKKLYQQHGNRLIHTIMQPLAIDNNEMKIVVIPYRGTLKGNNYNLAVSDGFSLYFIFNCERKQFEYYKVKLWGI